MGATLHNPFSKRFARDSAGAESPQGKSRFDSPDRAMPGDPVAIAPGTDTDSVQVVDLQANRTRARAFQAVEHAHNVHVG